MNKIGRYNDLTEEFKKSLELRVLKPGQVVTFRSTQGRIDPTDKLKKKVIYPKNIKIPPTDQIFDDVKNEMVTIGVIKGIDQNGNATDYIKKWADLDPTTGEFKLFGNRQEDRELYPYMQISSYNSKKANRFTNEEPLYYEVDVTYEAKAKNQRRSKKLEVELYVSQLGEKDLRMIGSSIAVDSADKIDVDVLRSEIWAYAEANADIFERLIKDGKGIESMAVLKRAFDYEILLMNQVERTVTFGGSVIATLPRVEGKKEHEQLDEYLKTTKNGDKIYESVKKLVAQQ